MTHVGDDRSRWRGNGRCDTTFVVKGSRILSENIRSARKGRRISVIAAAVGALIAAPLATWAATVTFVDVPPSHHAHTEITAVGSAGIMTGNAAGKFRRGRSVTRAGLAATLHRGLPRLAVDYSVGDISADPVDPELVAAVNLGVGGFEPGNQGVLVEISMQVEAAAPLTADCALTLFATSTPQNFDVGQWTTHLYLATGAPRCTRCSPTLSWPGPCTPTSHR